MWRVDFGSVILSTTFRLPSWLRCLLGLFPPCQLSPSDSPEWETCPVVQWPFEQTGPLSLARSSSCSSSEPVGGHNTLSLSIVLWHCLLTMGTMQHANRKATISTVNALMPVFTITDPHFPNIWSSQSHNYPPLPHMCKCNLWQCWHWSWSNMGWNICGCIILNWFMGSGFSPWWMKGHHLAAVLHALWCRHRFHHCQSLLPYASRQRPYHKLIRFDGAYTPDAAKKFSLRLTQQSRRASKKSVFRPDASRPQSTSTF